MSDKIFSVVVGESDIIMWHSNSCHGR